MIVGRGPGSAGVADTTTLPSIPKNPARLHDTHASTHHVHPGGPQAVDYRADQLSSFDVRIIAAVDPVVAQMDSAVGGGMLGKGKD